ncbi:hypothetical protein QFZ73_000972 [Peribacillus sp. V2I11]|nr:hypothetical protein [Peribacillus sp. V2I11]
MNQKQNPWAYAKPIKKDQPVKIKKDCGCNNKNKNKGY